MYRTFPPLRCGPYGKKLAKIDSELRDHPRVRLVDFLEKPAYRREEGILYHMAVYYVVCRQADTAAADFDALVAQLKPTTRANPEQIKHMTLDQQKDAATRIIYVDGYPESLDKQADYPNGEMLFFLEDGFCRLDRKPAVNGDTRPAAFSAQQFQEHAVVFGYRDVLSWQRALAKDLAEQFY